MENTPNFILLYLYFSGEGVESAGVQVLLLG
jgi:hypothetical protein